MEFKVEDFKTQYLSLLSNFTDCTEGPKCTRCATGESLLEDEAIKYLLFQVITSPRLFALLLYDCVQIGAALRDIQILEETLTK